MQVFLACIQEKYMREKIYYYLVLGSKSRIVLIVSCFTPKRVESSSALHNHFV